MRDSCDWGDSLHTFRDRQHFISVHPNRSFLEESADAVGYQHRNLLRRHIVLGRCVTGCRAKECFGFQLTSPDNTASNEFAAKLGLDPTGELDEDGEMFWKAAA